jgi:hypothetical protein
MVVHPWRAAQQQGGSTMHPFFAKPTAFGIGLICLASAMVVGLSTAATASTLNFENAAPDFDPIPDGYGGLHWSNFFASFDDGGYFPASGYYNGRVSDDFTAYNGFSDPAAVSSDVPFNLDSGYFTAAWNDGLTIAATGYRNGALLHSTAFIVNTESPYLKVFNWRGVDHVHFESFGGFDAGTGGFGTHFVLDNLSVSQTAIPSSLLMFGTALVGLMYLGSTHRTGMTAV